MNGQERQVGRKTQRGRGSLRQTTRRIQRGESGDPFSPRLCRYSLLLADFTLGELLHHLRRAMRSVL